MARALRLFATGAAARDWLSARIGAGEAISTEGAQSFGRFAIGLALQGALRPPSPAVRGALAHAAAQQGGFRLHPAASRAFAGALSELYANGVESRMVARAGRAAGLEEHARKLAAALTAHARLLEERGFLDPGRVATVARQAIEQGVTLPFDEIIVERGIEWNQTDLELCAALGRAVQGRIQIELPFDAERPSLFSPLEGIHQELYRLGIEASSCEVSEGADPGLRTALASLFKPAASGPIGAPVAVFTASSGEAEAREVAIRVRQLLREGVAPDRIAIAGPHGIGREITRALRLAGIPTAPVRGTRTLGASVPGRAALSVASLVADGIRREPLCMLLMTGLFPLGGRPGDSLRGRRLARDLRAAGSGDHRSGTLLPPLRRLLEQRRADDGASDPTTGRDSAAAQLELFEPRAGKKEDPLEPFEQLLSQLSEIPEVANVAGHARALWHLLNRVGATQALEAPPARELPTSNPLASEAAEARLALERLAELLGELADLKISGSPLPDLDRGEFASLLRELLSWEPAPEPLPAGSGVLLASFPDLIGRRFDHLFLVQLIQDTPSLGAIREELYVPAPLRRELRRELEKPALFHNTGRHERLAREVLLFALAASSASRSLTASAPRNDAKGRPIDASPNLAELARAAGVSIAPLGGAALPSGRECLNRREVVAAHFEARAVQHAEPELWRELERIRGEARERDAAIAAGRPHPLSGGLSAVVAENLREVLAFSAARPASASLISQLGSCGFRGLWDSLLKVRPPVERSEELDLREQGTLRHRCLEEVYTLLRSRNLVPLQGGPHRDAELKAVLEGIETGLERYAREQPVGHAVVFQAQKRRLRQEILGLYQADVDQGTDFKPVSFELAFKTGAVEPVALEGLPGGPAWIGGQIDRLDDGASNGFRVLEYKRGRIDDYQAKLREGFTSSRLQLPIYAALVSSRMGSGRPVDAKYVSVSTAKIPRDGLRAACEGRYIDPDSFLSSAPEVRERCRVEGSPNVLNRAAELLAGARSGAFAVQPGDCQHCTLLAACRVGPRYLEWDT